MAEIKKAEKKEVPVKKIAVVRVRGNVHLKNEIKDTLGMLRLYRKNYCVVLDTTPPISGMIKKVKDFITWGDIDEETLKNFRQSANGTNS